MDYTEIFDRYIDGQLEGKELEDFNEKLRTDNEFRQSLDKYIRLNKATAEVVRDKKNTEEELQIDEAVDESSLQDISKYGKDKRGVPDEQTASFTETLSNAEKGSLKGTFGVKTRRLAIQFAIAATVIVAILFTLFFLLKQNKIGNEALFTMYYKPYAETQEVLEITRTNDNFYYALKVFEAGDWARAAVLFDKLSDSAELKVYAAFYSGLTFMQMGRWEQAVKKLEEVVDYGETQVEKPALWYLGLCFLRIDDSVSARRQFEILASTKNEYTGRSRRILRLMR